MLCNNVHHLAASTESSERKAASDRLTETNNIGPHIEILASAPIRQFAARFHFIHDEKRAVAFGDVAQALQIPLVWHAKRDVHHNGLNDHGCNLIRILFEEPLDSPQIIERRN